MTSNNKTVYPQKHWVGNIAKTMTSIGKQFTVIQKMLTAVARDQSVQLKVTWFCRWNLSAFFKISFCFVLLNSQSLLMIGPLGNSEFCFPWILMLLGKQNSLLALGPVIKHGPILYNKAEVFSLSITNPNGRSMLPFDWLIHLGLILARWTLP